MTSKSRSTSNYRTSTNSPAGRCMTGQHGHSNRVKRQAWPVDRRGERQHRFLLRAKVDDYADGRNEASKQDNFNENQSTTLNEDESNLVYYSAYTHSASPTYFKWVNLTARQIHQSLIYRPGYMHSWLTTAHHYDRDQPHLLFYQNHPIQFVQIVGVVVSTEEWFERFWLFTIDDSSGRTIDVVCRKPDTTKKSDSKNTVGEDNGEKEVQQELLQLSQQVERDVQIGAVLQIKGTITVFQRRRTVEVVQENLDTSVNDHAQQEYEATRQISLQRLTVVDDTNAEMALVAARNKFFNEVLSKPWRLSKKEQERLYRKAAGESDRTRRRAKRQVEKLKKSAEDEVADANAIEAEYNADERRRLAASDEAREAGQNLLRARTITQVDPDRGIKEQTDHSKRPDSRRSKRQSNIPATTTRKHGQEATISDTTMSFGIDEDERSALLRAAFGF